MLAPEERRHSGRPDHHERKGDPFAPDDVGNREQRHHRDDDRVQRVGAALGERTGQGIDHVAQTTVEDEQARPEHDEAAAPDAERMDELHRPAADQEIGSDGQRQDDDADAESQLMSWRRMRGRPLVARRGPAPAPPSCPPPPRRGRARQRGRGGRHRASGRRRVDVRDPGSAVRGPRLVSARWTSAPSCPSRRSRPCRQPRVVCRWACSPPTRRRGLGWEPTQRHTPAWRSPRAYGTVRLRGVTRPDS